MVSTQKAVQYIGELRERESQFMREKEQLLQDMATLRNAK